MCLPLIEENQRHMIEKRRKEKRRGEERREERREEKRREEKKREEKKREEEEARYSFDSLVSHKDINVPFVLSICMKSVQRMWEKRVKRNNIQNK